MEKNQTSMCDQIFRAITSAFSPAFSTIRRPSSAKLHARNNPSLPNSEPLLRTLHIKTKPTSAQRPKPSEEGSEVPIKFDYTSPSTQNINGRAPLAWTAQHAKTTKPSADKVQSGKPTLRVASRIEPQTSDLTARSHESKAKAEKGNGQIQVQIERNHSNKKEAGKKPTHYDDRFTAFIHNTRKRIMSHDQEQGENSPKGAGHNRGHGFGKDHHFSDYIDKTKRKIRTTSSIKEQGQK